MVTDNAKACVNDGGSREGRGRGEHKNWPKWFWWRWPGCMCNSPSAIWSLLVKTIATGEWPTCTRIRLPVASVRSISRRSGVGNCQVFLRASCSFRLQLEVPGSVWCADYAKLWLAGCVSQKHEGFSKSHIGCRIQITYSNHVITAWSTGHGTHIPS